MNLCTCNRHVWSIAVNPCIFLLHRLLWSISLFLHYLSHSINFLLYLLTGSEFRQEVRSMLSELCVCKNANEVTWSHKKTIYWREESGGSTCNVIQTRLSISSVAGQSENGHNLSNGTQYLNKAFTVKWRGYFSCGIYTSVISKMCYKQYTFCLSMLVSIVVVEYQENPWRKAFRQP